MKTKINKTLFKFISNKYFMLTINANNKNIVIERMKFFMVISNTTVMFVPVNKKEKEIIIKYCDIQAVFTTFLKKGIK